MARAADNPHNELVDGWLLGSCIYVGLPVLFYVAARFFFKVMERIVLSVEYGEHRYARGLRIANKQGRLSDGTQLRTAPELIVFIGSFVLAAVVVAAYWKYVSHLHARRISARTS